MNFIKIIIFLIPLLVLNACERRDYITWKCQATEKNMPDFSMILDGASLKIATQSFQYCGSIGPNSYFDETCPSNINDAKIHFEQKLGIFINAEKKYQCKAL
jgi:hypothetical protein